MNYPPSVAIGIYLGSKSFTLRIFERNHTHTEGCLCNKAAAGLPIHRFWEGIPIALLHRIICLSVHELLQSFVLFIVILSIVALLPFFGFISSSQMLSRSCLSHLLVVSYCVKVLSWFWKVSVRFIKAFTNGVVGHISFTLVYTEQDSYEDYQRPPCIVEEPYHHVLVIWWHPIAYFWYPRFNSLSSEHCGVEP